MPPQGLEKLPNALPGKHLKGLWVHGRTQEMGTILRRRDDPLRKAAHGLRIAPGPGVHVGAMLGHRDVQRGKIEDVAPPDLIDRHGGQHLPAGLTHTDWRGAHRIGANFKNFWVS